MHCAASWEVMGSIPDGIIGIFHWHNPSSRTRLNYGPGVDSASNRNEYQEYFLGVKAASAYGWQPYHLHVPIVLKSGSLDLLEHLGPVQASNGIALLLFSWIKFTIRINFSSQIFVTAHFQPRKCSSGESCTHSFLMLHFSAVMSQL